MNRFVVGFWRKVRRGAPDECWPWLGYRKKSGHGLTQLNRLPIHASRKAWILTHGPITDGRCVLHRCENAICCNPAHLYLGSRVQNMADRFKTDGVTLVQRRREHRGRGRPETLSTGQKFELRELRESGATIRECALWFNISHATVYRMLAEARARLGTSESHRQSA